MSWGEDFHLEAAYEDRFEPDFEPDVDVWGSDDLLDDGE